MNEQIPAELLCHSWALDESIPCELAVVVVGTPFQAWKEENISAFVIIEGLYSSQLPLDVSAGWIAHDCTKDSLHGQCRCDCMDV